MAITVVQHASNTASHTSGTSATDTATFASNLTAGNCVVACFTLFGSGAFASDPSVSSVTTNGTAENWSSAISQHGANGSGRGLGAIYVDPNTGGGQKIIDITWSFGGTASSTNSAVITIDLYEVSGVATSSVVDKTNGGTGGLGTSWTSNATATTTVANEMWIGVVGTYVNNTTYTLTGPSSPWTNESTLAVNGQQQSNATRFSQISGFQVVSSTGTATYAGTASVSIDYLGQVVTLKSGTITSTGSLGFNLGMSGTLTGTDVTSTGSIRYNLALSGMSSETIGSSGSLGFNLAMSGTAFAKIPFPTVPLGLKIELLLNGTWTDITTYVYQRNPITISNRGRPNESSTVNAMQMNLTLNNRNGNFTPKNTVGLFYPYITRNTQIRVHVEDVAVNGGFYNGYRFWGEVSEWPVKWDVTGTDVYVDIQCSGLLRRLNQGSTATLGSPLSRYYSRLSGNNVPIAYWPCEDMAGSTQFFELEPSPAIPGTWTGNPNLASDSSFSGSDAIPGINGSVWTLSTGVVGNPIASGTQTYNTPGTYSFTVPPGVTAITSVSAIGAGAGGQGNPGGNSSLTGSGVTTVRAHGSTIVSSGGSFPSYTSPGGTGSTNSVHHDGGDGGTDSKVTAGGGGEYAAESSLSVTVGQTLTIVVGAGGAGLGQSSDDIGSGGSADDEGGAGGGSAGGASSAGNDGSTNSGATGGAGGAAVAPGGAGGNGGNSSPGNPLPGSAGSVPGGGGGIGGLDTVQSGSDYIQTQASSGNGAAGQVQFSFSGGVTPAVPANIWRFLLHIPSGGTTNGAVVAQMFTLGTIFKTQVIYNTGGQLQLKGLNSGGSTLFTSTSTAFTADNNPMLVEVSLTPNGTGMNWSLQAYEPGGSSAIASVTGTQASASIGEVTSINVNPNGTITDGTSIGHVSVQHFADTMTTVAFAANGYAGERAGARFTRVCTEQGVAFVLKGNASDTPLMGPQPDDTFMNILQEIESLDFGLLYELRDQFGLGYRTRKNLQNQTAVLTLDYSLAELAGSLEPVYDDLLTKNVVTVNRTNGSSATAVSSSGTMSIQDPPNGVGIYEYSLEVNANSDSQLANEAAWLVTLGTVDEDRYPQITIDLTRPEVAALFAIVPSVDVGDFIVISNPPAWLPSGNINQLAYGFAESLNAFMWTITMNAVPEDPYTGVGLPTW